VSGTCASRRPGRTCYVAHTGKASDAPAARTLPQMTVTVTRTRKPGPLTGKKTGSTCIARPAALRDSETLTLGDLTLPGASLSRFQVYRTAVLTPTRSRTPAGPAGRQDAESAGSPPPAGGPHPGAPLGLGVPAATRTSDS
jgi:hypothetical protein